MKSDWASLSLGELANFIDYRGKTPPKTTSGIPLVTAKIVKDNVIQKPTEFICEDFFDDWMTRGIPKYGNVIFTTEAPLGEVAQIKTKDKLAFAQRIIILQGKNGMLDDTFLFYALQYEPIKKRIEARSSGTTVFGIKSAELRKVLIDVPDYDTQKEIGAVLSSLDAKIAVNTAINHHLEQTAQTLFEQFLIKDCADEPLGILSDIAFINPARSLSRGQDSLYVEMANLPTQASFPTDWAMRPFAGGMKFTNGDTIMARITPCLENGKTAYINFLNEGEVAFGSTEYIVIAPKSGYCSEMFYFLARYPDFVSYAVGNMNGSSGRQRVSGEAIGRYELSIPSQHKVGDFAEVVAPIMESISRNAFDNRKLADLRTSLLPRLMSGKLSVATSILNDNF